MGKPLALIGGLAALAGVICGMLLEVLAWYNNMPVNSQIVWLGSLGGAGQGSTVGTYIPGNFDTTENILAFVAGIAAGLGGILALTQKKAACIIGALLILGGCVIFLYGIGLFDDTSIFWVSSDMHVGYGWMLTAGGGLLALIGAFTGDD